jgi:hypothetical protein
LALFGSEGEVALELVIEFLEFLQLQHSRSVLLAEANEVRRTTLYFFIDGLYSIYIM